MKNERLKLAGAACLLVLGLGCVGTAVVAVAFTDILGGAVDAITGLFQAEQTQERTLRIVLESGLEGRFTIGADCNFPYAQGSVVSSAAETEQGGGFQFDLSRQEVVDTVSMLLQEDSYLVRNGNIQLERGVPVSASLLGENAVSLSYSETERTDRRVTLRSMQGVAQNQRIQGSFTLDQRISSVENGQAIEEAQTLAADFECPLVWK